MSRTTRQEECEIVTRLISEIQANHLPHVARLGLDPLFQQLVTANDGLRTALASPRPAGITHDQLRGPQHRNQQLLLKSVAMILGLLPGTEARDEQNRAALLWPLVEQCEQIASRSRADRDLPPLPPRHPRRESRRPATRSRCRRPSRGPSSTDGVRPAAAVAADRGRSAPADCPTRGHRGARRRGIASASKLRLARSWSVLIQSLVDGAGRVRRLDLGLVAAAGQQRVRTDLPFIAEPPQEASRANSQ